MIDNFHLREGKVEFRWKRWRNKKRQEVSSCLMVLFSGAVLLGGGGVALAGPTGGQVTGGQGTITNPNGTTTNINQQSNVLNINWQDFSIGAGETVNFIQPGSTSIAINRVIGGVPSYLAGALNANGRVFILNSAGITFTGTSQVNVGALLATTAMTVNGDPTQAASYSGTGYGAVINQGSISVSNGGFAILAAPYVQNTGFIKADLGTIALAGTNQFTLDLSGTGLINFVVPAGAVEKIVSDGKAVGVNNSGTLQARSGQVVISANVASEVVNAVVNLNGIVDADAFAADGKGGSVLVTAAGDINVGGQVTAKGSGAGAGGQIITKAAGADVIGSMAYVSAVGGDGGKGGFIEVSGKQVGLHGTIQAGKGGALLIDPQDILVVASSSGALAPSGANSVIGTHFIEAHLAVGTDISLVANRDILFDALGDDHVLMGGSGNLTLAAGATQAGNILFGQHANVTNPGTQDVIQQAGGFIHMNANGGHIGSSAHAISLFSRSNSSAGITQAGDIMLKAGTDIHLKDVSIISNAAGTQQHARFTADAGHDFIASGDIDIEADAVSANPLASASANIFAHNNISLHGIQVVAVAAQSASGQVAEANANLQLNAACGNLTIDGAVNVQASAQQFGGPTSGQALAAAHANLNAGRNIEVGGDIRLSGFAQESGGSVAAANALLMIDAASGSINIGGNVDVNASAQLQGIDQASAIAWANLIGRNGVTVNGQIGLLANANRTTAGSDTGDATASANLIVNAGHGDVVIGGSILEQGFAQSTGAGSATGCAQANISGNAISIGGRVKLLASAINPVSEASSVDAFANLQLHAGTGSINIHGDVVVNAVAASASSLSPLHRPIATARANLLANTNVTIGGRVGLLAFADHDRFPGNGVNATADLDIKSPGVITIVGDIDVEADAASNGTGGANAIAQAQLLAARVSLNGSVDIAASANQHGGNGYVNALANLTVSANGADLSAGDIIVSARAVGRASDSVTANAQANLFGLNVTIDGNVAIVAIADEIGIKSAQALANLQVDAVTGNAGITGGVTVNAVALTFGSGTVQASALANVTAHCDVTLSGSLDVTACAHQSNSAGLSGSGVSANARLIVDALSCNVLITGSVDVTASASSLAHGLVRANALASIFAQNAIEIGGARLLAAAKNPDASAGSALASANLQIHANTGGIDIDRNILVNALAASDGEFNHKVAATARANLLADANIVISGDAALVASAMHAASSASAVNASANLDVRSLSGAVTISGDLSVNAKAASSGTGDVGAIAKADLVARSVSLEGGVDITASANQQSGSGGHVDALASLLLGVSAIGGSVQMNNGVRVTAHGEGRADDSVTANALANIQAFGNLTISGGIDIAATAHDLDSSGNAARAQANLQLHAAADSVNIDGAVTVNAIASISSDGTAQAIASANIVAGANVVANGSIDVDASAQGHGSANLVNALANLQVTAGGNASVAGNLSVIADAFGSDRGRAQALALANLAANTDVMLNGAVDVDASAINASSGDGAAANANLIVDARNGNVYANHGITVDAVGGSGGSHSAIANARANIFARDDVVIAGSIGVNASAKQHGTHIGALDAEADLVVHALFGNASLGSVHVTANGHASSASLIRVTALASISACRNIDFLGVVDVAASADQSNTSGSGVSALANLQVDAGIGQVNAADDIIVTAFAKSAGSQAVSANALANIFAGKDVAIGGDVDVTATAEMQGIPIGSHRTATGRANLVIDAAGSDVSVAGDANVIAHGSFSFEGSLARASALANITARDNVILNGAVHIAASADQLGTPTSGGGAIANANLIIHAGANVLANHGIHVTAVGDSGGFFNKVLATASVNILANNIVAIGTGAGTANIDVTASIDACAIANANALLHINADNVTVDGNVRVTANVVTVVGAADAVANAVVSARHDVSIDGAAVTACAMGANGVQGSALLQIDAVGDDVTLNHLDVLANVASIGSGLAKANAQANLFAHGDITIASDAAVTASALHSQGLGPTRASANLLIDANFGRVNVDGDLIVRAQARASFGDSATAEALARVIGGTHLHLGSANVTALASPGGSTGQANALASLQISVQSGDVVIDHDVTVDATADNFAQGRDHANAVIGILAAHSVNVGGNLQARAIAVESGSGSATASANIFLNARTGGIDVQGNVNAIADATVESGRSSAKALAQVTMMGGDINVHGNIGVDANALQQSAAGKTANALAELTINTSRNLHIGGDVAVSASAMASGSDPAALARANAVTNISGGGNFSFLSDIHDAARAHQNGTSGSNAIASADVTIRAGVLTVRGAIQENASATASADANALAQMSISVVTKASIEGNISVAAFADELAASANAAKASAVLDLRAGSINVSRNVEITASVLACGDSMGIAEANALASINATTRVGLHGIEIKALANQTASSGDEALASANLQLHGRGIDVAGGIRVSASAFAAGSSPGRAQANALANIVANNRASIGDIGVTARANDLSTSGSDASALANLRLHASSINMTGTVDVNASAEAAGVSPGIARATAQADIFASHDVRLNSVFVTAFANQHASSGSEAAASATLRLGGSNVTVPGMISVNAVATANGSNPGSAEANALASINGGHDLRLGDIAVTASAHDQSGSGARALANANLQLQGGSIHVSRAINVAAFATDFGRSPGAANAQALANIAAGTHNASLNDVSVTALANQRSSSGSQAQANAELQLQAANINVFGDVDVNASAIEAGRQSGTALACALANISAGTHNAFFAGNIDVQAQANEASASGTQAQALTNLHIHAGSINVHGAVTVGASASDGGPGSAIADATISLSANRNLSLGGLVATVVANEHVSTGRDANAHLNLQAFASNRLTVVNDVNVNVTADNSGSQGHASALASVLLAARGGASNAIDLRNVSVLVNALDHNGSGVTLANANVHIVDQNASAGGIQLHGLDVAASANELLGSQNAHASALANAHLDAHGAVNALGHDVLVTANAFDGSSANAVAQLNVNAGHVSLVGTGSIGAKARATAGGSSAVAHALASVDIAAATGNASVHGDLVGIATANYANAGGNAIGQIQASATVQVDAGNNVFVEDVTVVADAENFGDNSARGLAVLGLNAQNSIDIGGKVFVNALADEHSAAGSGATFAASANAQAHFNAHAVRTEGPSNSIDVRAHAINAGHKTAKASASLDFGAATLVNVGGLTLDVLADNSGQNGTNAIANAILTQTNSAATWVIGSHGINLHAVADSSGTGGANAHASLNMSQNEIDINGPVLVEADAHAGANAVNGALADATLDLHGNNIDIGGNATVIANAVALGAGTADASAWAALHGGTGPVTVGSNVTANAFASGHNASANALISIAAASVSLGGIVDDASAKPHGGGAHQALASVNILANVAAIDVLGSIELTAANGANATAILTMNAVNGSINIANDVTLDGGTASANLFAHHNIGIGGNLALSASHGNASLTMNAENGSINIGGDLTAEGQGASANLFAQHDIDVGGNVGLTAHGLDAFLTMNAENGGISIGGDMTLNGRMASANLVAGDDIVLRGNADVTGSDGNATLKTKAADDIALADVTVMARGNRSVNALFSASAVGGSFAAHDVDVSACAGGSLTTPGTIAAHATADIVAGQNVTMNAVHVHAVDTASRSSPTFSASYNAQANLQVNAATGNIHVNGNIDVSASASGFVSTATPFANAIANLHAGGDVGVTGSVLLDANVFDGAGAMTAKALLTVNAGGSIDLGGINVTAIAGSDGLPAAATAQASLVAGNDIAIEGNADLTALTTHSGGYGGAHAIAHANLLMNAGAGGVDIDGNIDVQARDTAFTGSAEANAFVNILANTGIAIGGSLLVSADAHQKRHSQEHFAHAGLATASLELQALGGSINIGGNLSVNALATSDSHRAAARASANLLASTKVVVDGNVDVMATANLQNATGVASANANLLINAGSINIANDLVVDANTPQRGHANAFANLLAAHDIDVGGNVELNAAGSQVANALLVMNAGGSIDIGSGVILDAVKGKANADLVASAIVAGSVDITANGGSALLTMNASNGSINIAGNLTLNAVGAKASANLLAASDIIFGGNADVMANQANATLLMNAQSGGISVGGDLSVVAKGGFVESGGRVTQALLSAHAGRNFLAHDVLDSATVGGKRGVYSALATANIVAQNNIVVSDVNVHASAHAVIANQLFSVSTAAGHATANLQLNAVAGSIHVNGDVAVDAVGLMNNIGSVPAELSAKALANLFAGKDVDVSGDVELHAKGNASSIASSGSVKAILTVNAGDKIDIGSIDELAEANEVHNLICAQANLVAGSGIVVERNVELNAQGSSFAGGGFVGANLQMNAGTGSVNVGGELQVRSLANFHIGGESAAALVDILAGTDIHIGNGAIISAAVDSNAASGVLDGLDVACANLHLHAVNGSIDIHGDVTVNALANTDRRTVAQASANLMAATRILIGGGVDVSANAGQPFGHEEATASAYLFMNAASGSINVAHDVGVHADAFDVFHASANALMNLQANNGLTIGGSVDATATADQNGTGQSWALACANIMLDVAHGDINVAKDIHASANALSKGSDSAIADGFVNANAALGDVLVHGAVTANAHAETSSQHGLNGALALSSITLHGDPVVVGSIVEHATASSHGTGHANAQANANVTADSITVDHNVDILAKASQNSDNTALASANLMLHAVTGSINIGSNLMLSANGGKASADLLAGTKIVLGNNANVTAHGGNAILSMNAATGSIDIGSDVSLFANGDGTVRARFSADAGGNVNARDVDVSASAIGELNQVASATAYIHAGSDIALNDVNVSADITVIQGARFTGSHAVTANIQLNAGSSIHVNGNVVTSATAGASASGKANAAAIANLVAGGNIDVSGNIALNAIASGSNAGGGLAKALLTVDAGDLASVGGNISVTANAHAASSAVANASANIVAGSLLLNGGVTGRATAIGAHGDQAFANLAMSASTGAVTVNGDIGAFAVADAASDAANASIAIIANGAITLNGADPIASARIGPGSGTTTALRQANHTTHDGPVTGPGGVAYANILIQGSSSTGGPNPPPPVAGSSLTQIEKLFALPTDKPTLTSTNTGLSIIQMLINGQDCGVFGDAGADANAIAAALACQKSPINVSNLTDSEP